MILETKERISNEMNRNISNSSSTVALRARQQQPAQTTIKRPTKPTMTTTPSSSQPQPMKPPTTGGGGDADKGRGKSKGPGVNMRTSAATAAANTRKVGTGRMATTTTTTTAAGQQPAGLMKKAHVRFDDYLDLNEENMRRSCKRLMNHLYSESSSSPAPSSPPSSSSSSSSPTASACNNSIGATTTIRKPQVSNEPPKKPPSQATGALLIKPSMANNSNSSKCKSDSSASAAADISINCKTAAVTAAATATANVQQANKQNSTIATSLPTIGKSYLRSQYERRQQRQLELMSKMQLEPGKRLQQTDSNSNNNNNNNADGANECRQQEKQQKQEQKEHQKQKQEQHQQQQDLVAKSHELSKRRFFEKLERRESIRNLNLSTPPPPPPPPPSISVLGASRLKVAAAPVAPDAKNCSLTKTSPTKTMHQVDNKTNELSQQQLAAAAAAAASQQVALADNRQNGLGDDELMLKVYQSIVLKGSTNLTSAATETNAATAFVSNCDGFNNDTLGRLDGPTLEAKKLANEPFGLCTQSQPDGNGQQLQQQPLIEFSGRQQQQLKQQQQQDAGIFEQKLIQLDNEMSNSSSSSSSTGFSGTVAHSEAHIEVANHSAFEIKVPETLNSSQDPHHDGFISSGLLIVRQVEELATVDSHLLPPMHQKQLHKRQLPAHSSASTRLVGGGPPTLSGRQEHKEGCDPVPPSTQLVANKTKTPPPPPLNVDESADNKIKQIDGHSSTDKTIDRSIIVGGATSLGSSSGSPSAAPTMVASSCAHDQTHQEQAALASGSITISSENNNNHHNSNNNELMNKAILRPVETKLKTTTTTTSNGIDHGGKLERGEFKASSGEHSNNQRKAIGGLEVEAGAKVGGAGGMVGESNCVKDHEAPEMRDSLAVGQSGGAAKSFTANCDLVAVEQPDENEKEKNSTAAVHLQQLRQPTTQSTAQAQQVASLQTTITTKQPEIRDVLPMANEINRIEAIVRGSSSSCSRPKLEALAADKQVEDKENEGATLVESAEQVNEVYGGMVQHERSDQKSDFYGSRDGYANAVALDDENEMRENNVNHDVGGVRLNTILLSAGGSSYIVGNAMGEHDHHLIEPFTGTAHHSSLTQKHSNSLSVEEDGGSSCSSSGFGASVSVTSSSGGSNSLSDTRLVVASSDKLRESGVIRRPNSLAVQVPSSRNGDQIYDSVRPRACAGRYQQQHIQNIVPGSENTSNKATNEFPDYKQLVGPDQAYPLKSGRCLLLVENHNYASILNRCDMRNGIGMVVKNEGILLCDDDEDRNDSLEGYANLPTLNRLNNIGCNSANTTRKVPPNVEYATVRPPTISNSNNSNNDNGSNNMDISQDKTKRLDDSASDDAATDLSGPSYSTTSANSGGFSALPPARQLECPSSNNLDPSLEAENAVSAKKSSILKRFGSLVSRAFTSQQQQQANVQPEESTRRKTISISIQPTKISESSSNSHDDVKNSLVGDGSDDGIARKSALVIEQNHNHYNQLKEPHKAAHKEQEIGEADLVILPPKHVNQRKQQPVDGKQQQQQHRRDQNIENTLTRRHGDRLSRADRCSRKLKKINSASVASLSTPASSSESPSSSSLSASSTNIRIRPNEQHPKRSESLFEDLESLVGVSEGQSDAYGKIGSLRKSRRRATSTSRRKQSTTTRATIEGRIEIDCVSPAGRLNHQSAKRSKGANSDAATAAANTKAGGPRSLLRIFNAISSPSQRSSESTPNLTAPMQQGCCSDYAASNCEPPIFGEQEEENDQSSLQPISGFWGFSSLMTGASYARNDTTASGEMSTTKVNQSKLARTKNLAKLTKGDRQNGEYSSMVYSANLQPQADGYSLHGQGENHSLDKYQSLNLYQNLLRNYAKRRNRNRHGHNHHHSHSSNHHHHSHHHHSHHRHSTRPSYRSMRCSAQNCSQLSISGSSSEISGPNQGRAVVWGQLIKINKADGSQVIELQRLPGKSWGFFVARGAINDIKGIFISRMHDSVTSNSLAGLLSIGDRIVAIDECPIGPDYDILRVNQMMSQKSKILLKVKPFKG